MTTHAQIIHQLHVLLLAKLTKTSSFLRQTLVPQAEPPNPAEGRLFCAIRADKDCSSTQTHPSYHPHQRTHSFVHLTSSSFIHLSIRPRRHRQRILLSQRRGTRLVHLAQLTPPWTRAKRPPPRLSLIAGADGSPLRTTDSAAAQLFIRPACITFPVQSISFCPAAPDIFSLSPPLKSRRTSVSVGFSVFPQFLHGSNQSCRLRELSPSFPFDVWVPSPWAPCARRGGKYAER